MTIPPEITELVSGSGNSFHAKVAQWFKEKGWRIFISPYYIDKTLGKAREIDLVVEKTWPDIYFGKKRGEFLVRLYIECKFITTFCAFWLVASGKTEIKEFICRDGNFKNNLNRTDNHHYLMNSRVAKLFATKGAGQEQDPLYKALNQSLNAMVSMGGRSLIDPTREFRKVLEYPVIVCNSFERMYGVDFFKSGEPSQIEDNFLLDVQYAYVDQSGKNRNDRFLIDFVSLTTIDAYHDGIEKDVDALPCN